MNMAKKSNKTPQEAAAALRSAAEQIRNVPVFTVRHKKIAEDMEKRADVLDPPKLSDPPKLVEAENTEQPIEQQ